MQEKFQTPPNAEAHANSICFDLIKWSRKSRGGGLDLKIGDKHYIFTARTEPEYGAQLIIRTGKGKAAAIEGYEYYPGQPAKSKVLKPFKGYWTDYQSDQVWVKTGENLDDKVLPHFSAIRDYLFNKPARPTMVYPFTETREQKQRKAWERQRKEQIAAERLAKSK